VAFAPSGMAYVTTVTGALFGFRYDRPAHRLLQLRGAGSCAGPNKKGCVNTPGVHGRAKATVSSDGRTLYVIGEQTDRVTAIRRDRRSGRLSQPASVSGRGLVHPAAIATSPDGRSVYVGSEGGIAIFARR
jgi:DNA-binding beta-propeller fold protein YncE